VDSGPFSHYRVIRKLGHGGVGEVYLAEDTRLRRPLAIKLLLPEHTQDPARLRRFEQEARAASALNHPNILTVYEVGEAAGRHYIATEYIEGETLRQKIRRGPLAPDEAFDIAAQVAEALVAAHARGIVHRDIKPENVMARHDGYVKVLDFGLAKLVEPEQAAGRAGAPAAEAETIEMLRTQPGRVMGTAWYMSPEQARGLAVDARTDLWSLGVLLYEMLAGRPPFIGETPSHVVVSILEDEPEPLTVVDETAGGAPLEVRAVVARALAKRPEERYQTAGEMLADLRALAGVHAPAGTLRGARSAGRRRFTGSLGPRRSGESQTAGASGEAGVARTSVAARTPAAARTSGEVTAAHTSAIGRLTGHVSRFDTETFTIKRGQKMALLAVVLTASLLAGGYLLYRRFAARPALDAIAVLPLVNASGDPSTEWLSDGITESLINSLAPAPGLKVMSRNAVFRYKGKNVEPARAARELGVGAVLTGEVIQRGEDLTVSVELIDARDDTHLWGEKYSRRISDILQVQEEIARAIAARLRSRLGAGEGGDGPKLYTRDSAAYQDYLRGRFFWNKRSEEGFRRAVAFFNQAIERDPSYALAYAGLADTYALMSDYSLLPPREAMPRARAAAERALELDDALAEGHTSRAFVHMAYEWKWAEAEADYRRAIELNPNYATAHQWYASLLVQTGRTGEALSEIRFAQELDPLSSIISANAGLYLYYSRRYDEAERQLRRTLEVDETFGVAHLYLGYVHLQQGEAARAVSEIERAQQLMGDDPETMAALGHAYAAANRRADALELLSRLRARGRRAYVSPYFMAVVYTGLGEREQALGQLEQAFADRHPGMILLKFDPRFDSLRGDARLAHLIARIEQGG
jgi:TolB-like protein/Tfp pilus assembly protein PilF/predicted Ser/Thr protein kinase